ncbi:MAG: 2-polyprenyl-6-methoxyphenol hydroxylase [bacterium]|nr:2-polyprenyl-6-methoxyphenol hydroxylase [bacterium]
MILVVGAGPTGLSLAIELARRGVPFRLVDKAATRSDKSRALAVQARSLELMRPWGVADELVARGQKAFAAQLFVGKQPSATVELGDIGVDDTPYPHLLFVSQAETERALDEALARLGGRIERGVELLSARQDADGVAVVLRGSGGDEAARFEWVVGCDGAHSMVRHAARLEFAGGAYEQDFMLADLAIEWDAPERLYFFLGKGENVVVFPLRDGKKRIIAMSGRPPAEGAAAEPTLDEFATLLGAVCPFAFRFGEVSWTARFRLHHRGVSRYRAGRLFVAGDAAHIHSPAGGQGMNTGIQDAINLGWKLALVARGQAPAAILDSYDEERRPVGQRLLQFTDRLFSMATSSNPLLIWARNRLIPLFAPRLMATAARRKLVFRFISQLGIRYSGASLVGDCGERAPDAMVDGVKHLVDAFVSPLHHLVVFGSDGATVFLRAMMARFSPELDGVVVDDAMVRRRYGVAADGWVLVRPDQYLAARAQSYDQGPLDGYFGARIGMSSSKRSR